VEKLLSVFQKGAPGREARREGIKSKKNAYNLSTSRGTNPTLGKTVKKDPGEHTPKA